MKLKLFNLFLIAMILPSTISCSSSDDESVSLKDISLNVKSLKLFVGESEVVKVSAFPEEASIKNLIWSTPDDIVSVTNEGLITAIKQGTTTVSVSTKDSKISKTITVSVLSPIEFEYETYSLIKGESKNLTLKYLSELAKKEKIIWESSDPAIASVSESGVVSAVNRGSAIITVHNASNTFNASCNVNVSIPVEGITLNISNLKIPKGKEYQILASIIPEDADNKNIKWSSSNSYIVSINENGVIKGIKLGDATITATTEDGNFTASCEVEVTSTENIEYTPYGEGNVW